MNAPASNLRVRRRGRTLALAPAMEHSPAGIEMGLLALREAGVEFHTARGRRRLRSDLRTRIDVQDGEVGLVVQSEQDEVRYTGPGLGVWLKRVISARGGHSGNPFYADEHLVGWGRVTVAATQETAWLCGSSRGVILVPTRKSVPSLRWSWSAVKIDSPSPGRWRMTARSQRGTVTVTGNGVASTLAARRACGSLATEGCWTLSVERRWGPMHLSGQLAVGQRGLVYVPTSSIARLGATSIVEVPWTDMRRIAAGDSVVHIESSGKELVFRTLWSSLLKTELRRLRWQAALATSARARAAVDSTDNVDLRGSVQARQPGEPWRWGVLSVAQAHVVFRPAGGTDSECVRLEKDSMHCTRLTTSRRPTLALANAQVRLEVQPAEGAAFVETFERSSGIATSRFRARPGKLRKTKWMLHGATQIRVQADGRQWERAGDALCIRDHTLSLDALSPAVSLGASSLTIEVSGPEGLFRFSAPIVGRVISEDLEVRMILGLPHDIAHHELRRDRRVVWELPAWLDRTGKPPNTRMPPHCKVRDISAMGVALESCDRMTVGQEVGIAVQLDMRTHAFTARAVRQVEPDVWAFVFVKTAAALIHAVLRKSRMDERARLHEQLETEP